MYNLVSRYELGFYGLALRARMLGHTQNELSPKRENLPTVRFGREKNPSWPLFIVPALPDPDGGERYGKSVGVFNVDGRYYALHNRCPHMGGTLCEGPLSGTSMATDEYRFEYGRQGQILRCGWHGWEFDVETGQALVDPLVRARTYQVTVENGSLIVHI